MAVSEAAATDIDETLGWAPGTAISCATGFHFEHESGPPPADLKAQNYFLAIGSVEPRKNLVRLVEAWRHSGSKTLLVVAGPPGWRSEEIEPMLANTPNLTRLSYLPRKDMPALVANAKALLFPTLAEGFGLPIVEAMALQTPVMTSRGGATEEVAGEAAFLIDPTSIAEMASAIALLDTESALTEKLSDAGLRRAEHFSEEAFMQRLAALHRRILTE
jgi:glycosyltransferase involved in cell wall biosynthesis